jgi:hypothetical protein
MPSSSYEIFNDITLNAISRYSFSQDEEYRKRVDEYEQPGDVACGKYRARDKMKQIIYEKSE